MREYKRSGASYAKDIVLTLLATVVAGGGVWLLQKYVMPDIAGTAGILALYAIPVVVFAGMLYITFVADSVKLSLKPNGTVTYRRAGAKPLKWDAHNCYFDWLNVSQTSGNTTPHDITLRITELNGEVAEVDCSPLGRRNFERFMRDVGEIALWRIPEDVLPHSEPSQEPGLGLPGQMTLEGLAQPEEAEQAPVELPENKKEKRKARKQRKEAEQAAELEELAEQEEAADEWMPQEELPEEPFAEEPVLEQAAESQQVWPPQEPVTETLAEEQVLPAEPEPLGQVPFLQEADAVVSYPAYVDEGPPQPEPAYFAAKEPPAPPVAPPVVVKPILPGDEPPVPPRRGEPEAFRAAPVEPAAPVKPILPGDPLPPEPEVLPQEEIVAEDKAAEMDDTQIVIPHSGMPRPVLHNAPPEEPAPEQEEEPRSLFADMVRQGKEQAAQTAVVKEREEWPETEQREMEAPVFGQPEVVEPLPVAAEEPFLQEAAAGQETMTEQPFEAPAQQVEAQAGQIEQEVPLQNLFAEQTEPLTPQQEEVLAEPVLASQEQQAEQPKTPGKRWRMKK